MIAAEMTLESVSYTFLLCCKCQPGLGAPTVQTPPNLLKLTHAHRQFLDPV